MRTKTLIKTFMFEEENRKKIILGEDARLDPIRNHATMKLSSSGFAATAELRSWVSNPGALVNWSGFSAEVRHFADETTEAVTSAFFRISDGFADFYWNGSAWVAPVLSSEWNTEQEVADHILTFPVQPRSLQVVVQLRTADSRFAPQLLWIKLLYEAQVEFTEDIIYRSLIPLMRSEIRPLGRFTYEVPAGGASSFTLANIGLETPYNVVGFDSCFVHSSDPNHYNNIFQSYNSGTGVVTLSQTVAAGAVLWGYFLYEPEIAMTTSQDYIEQEKIPAIVLDEIQVVEASELPDGDDYVENKGAGTAVLVPSPVRGDITIKLIAMTDKGVDHLRLGTELNRFFARHPLLKSTGLDEEYRLWLTDEFEEIGEPGQEEIHMSVARIRIVDFLQWLRTPTTENIVHRMRSNMQGEPVSTSQSDRVVQMRIVR